MELIDQHTKRIMEGCKVRAREAGLRFEDETLEYIVTNRDLLELSPKVMIPTLYDYWVHDVEVLKEKGRYELYPNNPFETVINTRPAISFYNDNNPDWLNVMIFYHVLAHIDFFQNNMLFRHTWDEDFAGRALSDKRLIATLRAEKGRWVDYVIEFTRGIDNLVGFHRQLSRLNSSEATQSSKRLDFYFDHFLQVVAKARQHEYVKEIERYNALLSRYGDGAEAIFFADILKRHPEFEALEEKQRTRKPERADDLIQYLQEHSPFLQRQENRWMKTVMQIVRNTSLFFQPQMRTKILNEGWASYWHEKLFLADDRISGNEVGFSRVNAQVTALPRVGLNPYALGLRLFAYVEELADKGKRSKEYQRMANGRQREAYDRNTGTGSAYLFEVRENYSDFMFVNTFLDQDFVDRHRLFVSGKRLNAERGVWEYYVKSRKAGAYKEMLRASLYHPPHIRIDSKRTKDGCLYLDHQFEDKPLIREYIDNTMLGIAHLWGGPVKLETTEPYVETKPTGLGGIFGFLTQAPQNSAPASTKPRYRRVLHTMADRKLTTQIL